MVTEQPAGSRWEMQIIADAEVIPGPRRRIRELIDAHLDACPQACCSLATDEKILAILNETEGPL